MLGPERIYAAAREFARLVSRAGQKHGLERRLVVVTGGGPGVMEAASRHGASLLCVGRNRTGLTRLLLGSVAAQVARNSAIPVLVVPPAS